MVEKSRENEKRIDSQISTESKVEKIVILSFFCGLFLFFFYGSIQKEFWYDEVATLGFVCSGRSLLEVLNFYLTIEASNLPLYALIILPFYQLLPAENIWLLLPGIFLTMGGIYFLYRMAREKIGRTGAVVLLLMAAFSTTVVERIGLELRAYSLMFFSSASSIYFLGKQETESQIPLRQKLTLGISLFALIFSHYFGVLFFAMLGIYEVILVIAKKRKIGVLTTFLIPGILFVVWFVLTRINTTVSVTNFWIEPPGFLQILESFGYLLGGNYLACVIYGISFILVTVKLCKKKNWLSMEGFCLLAPIIMISGIFLYSRYLSAGGGLYENRYFIAVLPCLFYTIAGGCERFLELFRKRGAGIAKVFGGLLLFLTLITMGERTWGDVTVQYDKYSFSARYIIEQGDLQNEDTLLVAVHYDEVGRITLEGWYDYYLVKKGVFAENMVLMGTGDLNGVFEEYRETINRIYVMGDVDFIHYDGTDYQLVEQWYSKKFSVYERVD